MKPVSCQKCEKLIKSLSEIYELAEWHTDDDADPDNTSPKDMASHVNGLIRQICKREMK